MDYDVVVIGSGPGGYVAAIRCAQLGMKTAIVEKEYLGGTCLNVGCIPSKALLDSTEHFHNAQSTFETHGIKLKNLEVDMPQMIKRKAEVVEQNVQGVEFLMKKNKIDVHWGWGSFKDDHTILIKNDEGDKEITAEKVIIATGSKPNLPEMFNYDGKRVISSDEAIEIKKVPKKMVVVGGGYIGLEMGSVFARLGTEVHIIEYAPRVIPAMDADCSKTITKAMKKLGIKFHTNWGVTDVKATSRSVTVTAKNNKKDETQEFKADYCLVAIGRVPYTEGLGLENIGLKTDDRGKIEVNEHLQTAKSHIYALGDVVRGAMLAHKAEDEGVFVAEKMDGQKPHINYKLIPGVVYTWPEIASVGHTEEELKEQGIPYKKGKFPYMALGRARASMDTEGMVKILAHEETDEVLGMHIVGARAADMIAEGVAVMEYRGSAEDIAMFSHAHPTYTEAIKEAALDATGGRSLHS
ncbi:MAG TPA: dihydrolipoyl dehydrogenase [Saprospiraceae bacterium]|nr:dihydrolipoyl dehydrogenase [Saprospiraceae bacterium]